MIDFKGYKWPALHEFGMWSLGGVTAFLLAMKGTAIYSIMGAILLVSLIVYFYKKRFVYMPDRFVLIALGIFAGGLFISSILQGEPNNFFASLHYVYLMATFIIMYVGVCCFGKNDILYKAIAASAIVTAVSCVCMFFDPKAWAGVRFSPITNPNVAVQYMVLPVSFIVVALYELRKNKFWFCSAALSLAVILIAAGLTRSRGGIAGLAAGLLILLALYWPVVKSQWSKKKKFISSMIIASLVPLLVISVSATMFSRGNSDQERVRLLQTAAHMFIDYPVTGVGMDNWAKMYPHYRLPGSRQNLPTAHNDCMNLLATTGILGGGGYLIFSFMLFAYLMWRIVRQPEEPMLWAMMWMFISVYIHGLVDISIQYNSTAKMFFGMLGFTLAIADRNIREGTD